MQREKVFRNRNLHVFRVITVCSSFRRIAYLFSQVRCHQISNNTDENVFLEDTTCDFYFSCNIVVLIWTRQCFTDTCYSAKRCVKVSPSRERPEYKIIQWRTLDLSYSTIWRVHTVRVFLYIELALLSVYTQHDNTISW